MAATASAPPQTEEADLSAGQGVRLPRGYASAVVADEMGGAWIAWVTYESDEAVLFSTISRRWPLRPGITPEQWRDRPPSAFVLHLGRIMPDGTMQGICELGRSPWAIEGPVLAARSGDAPWVVWIERGDNGWALRAWHHGQGGGGHTLVRDTRTLRSPAAVVDADGRLRVAWQGADTRGTLRIYVGSCDATAEHESVVAHALSRPDASAWSPALAAGDDGRVWCAWDAWNGEYYRVNLSRQDEPGSAWREPLTLTTSATAAYDLEPSIAVDGEGRAWVAWSHSNRWGRLNHRFWHYRSVHVQVVDPHSAHGNGLAVPLGYDDGGAVPIPVPVIEDPREEETIVPIAPRILAGPGGVRLLYRRLQHAGYMGFGWGIWGLVHTGSGWSAPERLSSAAGFPDTPYGIAADLTNSGGAGGAIWLAYHACDYGHPAQPAPGELGPDGLPCLPVFSKHAVEDDCVVLERVHLNQPTNATVVPLRSVEIHAGGEAAQSGQVRERTGSAMIEMKEAVDRALETGGERLQLLFGDLHRHSLYSKCLSANDGAPLDHLRWAHDVAALDFYALTEHLEYMSEGEWRWVDRLASDRLASDRLLRSGETGEAAVDTSTSGPIMLHGFELAWPPGHANFFYVDEGIGNVVRIACLSSATLSEVWDKLDAWLPEGKRGWGGAVLAIRHHQGHSQPDVAVTYAAQYEPLVEIIQSRGEFSDWATRLLRAGWMSGFVGATDHTYAGAFPTSLTGVWAGEATPAGVFDALWQRRTFATNGPKLRLFFTAAGTPMGGSGRASGAPELCVDVEGTTRVDRVEYFRNGQLLHVESVDARRARVTFVDQRVERGRAFYFVRVVQDREHRIFQPHYGVAYSSPVWLDIH